MQRCASVEIDLGYWWANLMSKKLLGDNRIQMRSKVELTDDYIKGNGTYRLIYENVRAIVGEGAKQHPIELDKTKEDHYRILTYALIAELVKGDTPTEINLVINYPLNIYSKKTSKEFSEFIKTKDYISVQSNSKNSIFWIKNCITFPQTIPVAYVNPKYFKDRIAALLDIGGLTTQGVILDNFNIVPGTSFTENLGCLVLYNSIRKALNKAFSINVQDYEMPQVIKNGIASYKEKSLEIINREINEHIKEIKKHMKLSNWNIEGLEIVLTGGGVLVMEQELLNTFRNSNLSSDPLWDNTKGLREVSDDVYAEKSVS